MEDNQLIAGRWWTATDCGKPLVSISSEYQEALELKLGDELSFDIAGEALTVTRGEHPQGPLGQLPAEFLSGVSAGTAGRRRRHLHDQRVPDAGAAARRWSIWCGSFPTVSVFDVDAILKQIRDIMDRASLAVQYVFLFTLVAGVVVLLAAVQSTRDERRYESAMLRTLGASRGTVLQGVAAEFSALGFLSGTLGGRSARAAVGWMLARRLFSLHSASIPGCGWSGSSCGTVLVGCERHACHAARRQHAAHRHPARRLRVARAVTSMHFEDQPARRGSGCRAAAVPRCARYRSGGESRGIEGQAQFVVRVLEQIVQDQRASLILLVDEHAKLRRAFV